VKIIEESSHDPKSKIRVFQALRIEVNQEFEHIRASLHEAIQRLEVGGRIIVITFHSLEDRLVKHLFAEYEKDTIDEMTGNILTHGILRRVTKKPLIPREEEMIRNPRSRSAKMRIVEKRGTGKGKE
jgi:16S rRNA (cytosine1402-N4)-methyltransferase